MSKLTDTQPSNLNQLNVVGFEVNIARLPNVAFFCQRVNIPGVILGETVEASPFLNNPLEGDTLTFESLTIGFILDEDMQNYIEIYNWLSALGFPKSYDQFSTLKRAEKFGGSTDSLYSDINIMLLTNKSNPNYKVSFQDIFPTSLSSLNFDAGATTIEPIIVDATFNFRGQFEIEKIV
jgi:hypothetical protein